MSRDHDTVISVPKIEASSSKLASILDR